MSKLLLLIDPQNDFMDLKGSSLPVKGSVEDMQRVMKKISSIDFQDVAITLDKHNVYDIAHANFWKNKNGDNPNVFDEISFSDVVNEIWQPVSEDKKEYCLHYLKELEKQNKYKLIIWPEHCIMNTWGSEIYSPLKKILESWENKNKKSISLFEKGKNSYTEHYSAFKAEVVIKDDLSTDINVDLLNKVLSYKEIYIAGEAFTHCVYSTVKDLMLYMIENSYQNIPDFIIFENATSPVSGFENKVDDIKRELMMLNVKFEKI